MDEAQVDGGTAKGAETIGLEKGFRRGESAGGEFGCGAEERVHETVDGARPEARESSRGNCEVREKPGGIRRSGTGEPGDELLELVRAKTIEKKMRDDEIERRGRQRTFEGVRVNERNIRV